MGSCYGSQRRVCSEKKKDISIVENRKEGSIEIYKRLVEEGVYLSIKVTIDVSGILCTKKE